MPSLWAVAQMCLREMPSRVASSSDVYQFETSGRATGWKSS